MGTSGLLGVFPVFELHDHLVNLLEVLVVDLLQQLLVAAVPAESGCGLAGDQAAQASFRVEGHEGLL